MTYWKETKIFSFIKLFLEDIAICRILCLSIFHQQLKRHSKYKKVVLLSCFVWQNTEALGSRHLCEHLWSFKQLNTCVSCLHLSVIYEQHNSVMLTCWVSKRMWQWQRLYLHGYHCWPVYAKTHSFLYVRILFMWIGECGGVFEHVWYAAMGICMSLWCHTKIKFSLVVSNGV